MTADPKKLGEFIWRHPYFRDGTIVALGLSEVVRTGEHTVARDHPVALSAAHFADALTELDDLAAFMASAPAGMQSAYLTHLVSSEHNSAEAMTNKWCAPGSRFRRLVEAGKTVNQGSAFVACEAASFAEVGQLIRYPGFDPVGSTHNNPLNYSGDRNSEPRAALLGTGLLESSAVTIAFTQLETNADDVIDGRRRPLESVSGSLHRQKQLRELLSMLGEEAPLANMEPAILLGDFNTVAGSRELRVLAEAGFRMPEYGGEIDSAGRRYHSPKRYSHLGHQLLIDLAFIRALPAPWKLSQYVLKLENEDEAPVSDHRPLVLEIVIPPANQVLFGFAAATEESTK